MYGLFLKSPKYQHPSFEIEIEVDLLDLHCFTNTYSKVEDMNTY